jgi:hypothetical protein
VAESGGGDKRARAWREAILSAARAHPVSVTWPSEFQHPTTDRFIGDVKLLALAITGITGLFTDILCASTGLAHLVALINQQLAGQGSGYQLVRQRYRLDVFGRRCAMRAMAARDSPWLCIASDGRPGAGVLPVDIRAQLPARRRGTGTSGGAKAPRSYFTGAGRDRATKAQTTSRQPIAGVRVLNQDPDSGLPVAQAEAAVDKAIVDFDRVREVEEALSAEINHIEPRLRLRRAALHQALSDVVVASPEFMALFDELSQAWTRLRSLRAHDWRG